MSKKRSSSGKSFALNMRRNIKDDPIRDENFPKDFKIGLTKKIKNILKNIQKKKYHIVELEEGGKWFPKDIELEAEVGFIVLKQDGKYVLSELFEGDPVQTYFLPYQVKNFVCSAHYHPNNLAVLSVGDIEKMGDNKTSIEIVFGKDEINIFRLKVPFDQITALVLKGYSDFLYLLEYKYDPKKTYYIFIDPWGERQIREYFDPNDFEQLNFYLPSDQKRISDEVKRYLSQFFEIETIKLEEKDK